MVIAERQDHQGNLSPVAEWMPKPASEESIAATTVPRVKRQFQVLVAVIYCLFAAGVVFGYAAFKPVLVKEGVYSDLCTEDDPPRHNRTCDQQEIRLNLMFTVAAVATNVCALPVGTILDVYGPRISGIIGSILITVGSLLWAFAPQLPFDAYIPGYLFLALGGPFIFISSFHLSNTFPKHSGLILALLTGAFDSSSAVFMFYRITYTASHARFTPQKLFSVYLIVPFLILLSQLLLMPGKSYKTVGEIVQIADDPTRDIDRASDEQSDEEARGHIRDERRKHRESAISEVTSLLGTEAEDKIRRADQRKKETSGVWGALHGSSATEQIKTPWFIFIMLFTVVQMTRINYFVATIRPQYEYLLGDYELAKHVNEVFDVALPAGGVLSIPFIGLILDNRSTTFVLALLVSMAAAIGILGIIPSMWAAYANIVLFVAYRPLYYTAVSDYAAKVFGFHTFGKVYGLIICLAGLLNLSQSGLDALTLVVFNRNPVPVDVMLLSISLLIGIALVVYIRRKSQQMKRSFLEEDAEADARIVSEMTMPFPTDDQALKPLKGHGTF
ncbi:MAG: hypothetical protein MMC33_009687 [Icmadophila ericetorum]|nr:hypothetical protein [Icmadophila ericetorum]